MLKVVPYSSYYGMKHPTELSLCPEFEFSPKISLMGMQQLKPQRQNMIAWLASASGTLIQCWLAAQGLFTVGCRQPSSKSSRVRDIVCGNTELIISESLEPHSSRVVRNIHLALDLSPCKFAIVNDRQWGHGCANVPREMTCPCGLGRAPQNK